MTDQDPALERFDALTGTWATEAIHPLLDAVEPGSHNDHSSFDSRGVRRTYGASLEDGVLRLWRDDPTFAQRFSAKVGTTPSTASGSSPARRATGRTTSR